MNRHRPGTRVRLRRGRVAHLVASIGTPDDGARFTLCGVPVLLDDRAALIEDPDCVACYSRPARRRPRGPHTS
ncbi:MAG TPA: hypothetical protein K8W24_15815 [Brachybacterium paraconglomeratum]|uniref:Uncharacterized protein n=1 Tax=Brachybacterium paraconglomeratum TaxID=173362 RepID=A0A921GRZ4_9MICO|nr:hypothetical protein [Brachybacterium paraconglomeratum]